MMCCRSIDLVLVADALNVCVGLRGACRTPLAIACAVLVDAPEVRVVGVHVGDELEPRALLGSRPGPYPLRLG
eukprot:674024-Rhodomonas_salina.1